MMQSKRFAWRAICSRVAWQWRRKDSTMRRAVLEAASAEFPGDLVDAATPVQALRQ